MLLWLSDKVKIFPTENMSSSKKITSIISNRFLASDIQRSISLALRSPHVHLVPGKTVWEIFNISLKSAIRDIKEHPRGKLFRRLIEYGPLNPDDPESLVSDGETTLSDPECGSCVEFIYSHMVNRFKGELAELLSIEPCINLVQQLQKDGRLLNDSHLYWGDIVQEPRRSRFKVKGYRAQSSDLAKGADGLIVQKNSLQKGKSINKQSICGIIEVKSMRVSKKRMLDQINNHIARLADGVKLGTKMCTPDGIKLVNPNMLRIMVIPSNWKLSREWQSVKNDKGRNLVFPESTAPPIQTQYKEIETNLWKVTLDWSQEALEQAAYEMTFWYMSQVGTHIYSTKSLPKGWEYMTPEQAGYNAIKMMLYYVPLRYISKRQDRLATRLYNVYSFGYPLGVDSKEMLWPEDFPE